MLPDFHASGERIETTAGDVVICPAGEEHVHGSAGGAEWAHLTISTGKHDLPNKGRCASIKGIP